MHKKLQRAITLPELALALFISPPEPKAHWWAYSIDRHPSSVVRRMSHFVRRLSVNIFKYLLLRRHWPIEATFYVEALYVGGTKVPSNGHGHMTKMAAMPIYDKNLKKSSSLEPNRRWSVETWYTALCTRVVPNSFKWWPWVDTDLFYGKFTFGPLCFCMGKS